jgi:hypothetical protein
LREEAVQRGDKAFRGYVLYIRVEIGDLADCVNARVRPTRSRETDRMLVQFFQGRLYAALHGAKRFTTPISSLGELHRAGRRVIIRALPPRDLPLPAGEIRAVVRYQKPNVPFSHQSSVSFNSLLILS